MPKRLWTLSIASTAVLAQEYPPSGERIFGGNNPGLVHYQAHLKTELYFGIDTYRKLS
jgi:hypothetical protein